MSGCVPFVALQDVYVFAYLCHLSLANTSIFKKLAGRQINRSRSGRELVHQHYISLIGVPSAHVRQPCLQSRKWKNNGHVRTRIFINYPVKIYKNEFFLNFNILYIVLKHTVHRF